MYKFKKKIIYNAGFGKSFNTGAPVPADIHPGAIKEMLKNDVIELIIEQAPVQEVKPQPEPIVISEPVHDTATPKDYADMTGKELEPLLIENGLAIRGSKADKIKRLEGI